MLAAPVKGLAVELGLGATPKPELATAGAVPAGAIVVATWLAAGAVGVKTLVVGTNVGVVKGPLVTVTVWLAVAV